MSNHTIDPRVLSRHYNAQDPSIDMVIRQDDQLDEGAQSNGESQIVVANDYSQLLASPSHSFHDHDYFPGQHAFPESSVSNIFGGQHPSTNSLTYSLQPPGQTSSRVDVTQPSDTTGLPNPHDKMSYDHFNQKMPHLFDLPDLPDSSKPLEPFGEYDQFMQLQGPVISPALHNSQHAPTMQLDSFTLCDFERSDFNDVPQSVPSSFWDSQLGNVPPFNPPDNGTTTSSQMSSSGVHNPYPFQSQPWIPGAGVLLDPPLYETSCNPASGIDHSGFLGTNITDNSVFGVASGQSCYNLQGERNAGLTVPWPTVSAWPPPPATESIDMLYADQHVPESHNEGDGFFRYEEDTLEADLPKRKRPRTGNGTEIIDVSDDTMCQPNKLSQSTESTKARASVVIFGPSRPVSLPPARRGGRKDHHLSAEERKNRMESRKNGVCIRCRQMKSKCRGGIPCVACLENSKATLWIHPCVKAHFLDIVECGSYFSEIAGFQKETIDRMNDGTAASQLLLIQSLHGTRHSSYFVVGLLGVVEFPCAMNWDATKPMLTESKGSSSSIKTILAHLPQQLAQSKSSLLLILLGSPGETDTRISRLFRRAFFCLGGARHWYGKDEHLPFYGEDRFHLYKKTRETLAWIGRRTEEIKLFRHYQETANRITSMTTRNNTKELSDFCGGVLQVLFAGGAETFTESKELHNDEEGSEGERLLQPLQDRRNRIRHALVVYASIAISKLPGWSNFWQQQQESSYLRISSDALKHSLKSLENFDKQFSNAVLKLQRRVREELASLIIIENKKKELLPYLSESGVDKQELQRQAIQNAARRPLNLNSDLQRSIDELEYMVKPYLQEFYSNIYEVLQSIQDPARGQSQESYHIGALKHIDGAMHLVYGAQRQLRERLEKQSRSEEMNSECKRNKELLERADIFIKNTVRTILKIDDEIDENLKVRYVIWILISVDLPLLKAGYEEFSKKAFTKIKDDIFNYFEVLHRITSAAKPTTLAPNNTILRRDLKKEMDKITLLMQKEKFKWLRVALGYYIVRGDQGIKDLVLYKFVREFLGLSGHVEDVEIKDI